MKLDGLVTGKAISQFETTSASQSRRGSDALYHQGTTISRGLLHYWEDMGGTCHPCLLHMYMMAPDWAVQTYSVSPLSEVFHTARGTASPPTLLRKLWLQWINQRADASSVRHLVFVLQVLLSLGNVFVPKVVWGFLLLSLQWLWISGSDQKV